MRCSNCILNNNNLIPLFRRQQELESNGGHGSENPALMNELRALRMRKDELETHLTTLQDSRRQLMIQLEGLMKMLKVQFMLVMFVFKVVLVSNIEILLEN